MARADWLLMRLLCIGLEYFVGLPHPAQMDRERDRLAIHERLARCRQLAREYVGEPTATNIRELEAELLAQLRQLEEQ